MKNNKKTNVSEIYNRIFLNDKTIQTVNFFSPSERKDIDQVVYELAEFSARLGERALVVAFNGVEKGQMPAGNADFRKLLSTGGDRAYDLLEVDEACVVHADRMRELTEWAKKDYDKVFCVYADSCVFSNAGLASRYMDGTVLLIEGRAETERELAELKNRFDAAGIYLIGGIFVQPQ